MKFWRIAVQRGEVNRALCLTTFTRTLDGRKYTFGVLAVGGVLSITERSTGRCFTRSEFRSWDSVKALREQAISAVALVEKRRGARQVADYFDALAAHPLNWNVEYPLDVAPPPLLIDAKGGRHG